MALALAASYAGASQPEDTLATPIRVALVGLPLMMRDIIHRILEGQRDIAVTADDLSPFLADGAPAVESEPVVIITSAPDAAGTALPEKLLNVSRRGVLVLASDGRDAVMHEAHLLTTVYPDVHPADLVAAIRRHGQRSALQ